jgi:hypothetical protein
MSDYDDYDVVTDEDQGYDYEEEFDAMLAQQELEDFAQDGYFENMEMGDDGFWH